MTTTLNNRIKRRLKIIVKQSDHFQRPDRLAQRARIAQRLAKLAEDGRVAIVSGGMDCDGGRWDGHVDLIPASVMALEAWRDAFYDGAEGPQWYDLYRPSSVEEVRPSSRDMALEAFEDGHPHSIHL